MESKRDGAIAELNRWLAERALVGSWSAEQGADELQPTYPPFLWKWTAVQEALTRIGPIVERDSALNSRLAGYKHFGLDHPGLAAGVSPTINMGAQVLMPGEHGEARRHLQAEFRFILKGSPGAYAVVEGERFPLETGDLLATPAWCWYDWVNEGDEPVFWLNIGDLTLTRLAFRFRDVHPEGRQTVTKPDGYWERAQGRARPAWIG